MFGRVGARTVILLHPKLNGDEQALRRTLSHEMVHAALYASGDSSTDHGPAFQAILKRLAGEGAFAGIVASQPDIEALRAWLDAEGERLAGEQRALEQMAQELERERRAFDEAVRRVEAAGRGPSAGYPEPIEITAQRAAYNDRAARANERADRYRAAVDAFNREIERYNLMVSYPDGLDEDQLKPKLK
jgi:Asp-tRNA(Asn)/Glu-tRNA(Gln) amidotransferase A subunit family amidase